MFGDLLAQGIMLRDKLTNNAVNFDAFVKPLTIVSETAQTEITPLPRIQLVSVSPEPVEGINDLRGVVRKFDVTGVSKKYPQSLIEQDGVKFLFDDEICHLVPGTLKEGSIAWSFQLQIAFIELDNFYG